MICSRCSYQAKLGNERFCPKCGTSFGEASQLPQSHTAPGHMILSIVGGVTILLHVVVIISRYSYFTNFRHWDRVLPLPFMSWQSYYFLYFMYCIYVIFIGIFCLKRSALPFMADSLIKHAKIYIGLTILFILLRAPAAAGGLLDFLDFIIPAVIIYGAKRNKSTLM